MILPWVTRERLQAAERLAVDELHVAVDQSKWIDSLTSQLAAERLRFDNLLEKYHQLRLQGMSEPPTPVVVERQKPDPLKQAIAAKCGNNRQLRENMERQAAYDRQAGMSDAEIVLKINAGVSPEETFAVAGL